MMLDYFSSSFPSDSEVSEDLHLLCMLHNIGATAYKKSLTIQQISEWTRTETQTLQTRLTKLIELGYVQLVLIDGTDKYHLTINGIRKVLSIYS